MKENFLIVYFYDDYFDVLGLKIDFQNKKLEVSLNKKNLILNQGNLKKIFTWAFYPKSYKIIFVLDSKRGWSNFESVAIVRDDPVKPLSSVELENLISQAVWKVFDAGRHAVAKRFNVGDLEILLGDIKVIDFKIDGREVIDSLKHSGKKVEIYLSQTFSSRQFFQDLLSFMPKRAELSWAIDGGAAAGYLLSEIFNKNKFFFVKVAPRETFLFSAENTDKENKIVLFDYLNWGSDNFYSQLSKDFGVSEETGHLTVEKFLSNNASEFFSRRFGKFFSKELTTLTRGIKNSALSFGASDVYLDFPPFTSVLNLKFSKIFPKMIKSVYADELMKFFGFNFGKKNLFKKETDHSVDFLVLSAFFSYNLISKKKTKFSVLTTANRFAKRRMRWLMAV
ncbi:hypothetical protein HZB06_03365 [Candidatus Wolfebacteria bacterium]|nr:hypothetical protein [Candidatus Wolfebacteria bacterium]